MANTAANVVVGKPKATGGVYAGTTAATLPTNPTSALDGSLTALGYVSEDGLTQTKGGDTTPIRAWGGDEIRIIKTTDALSYAWSFLETSPEVLAEVYGDDNVSTAGQVTTVLYNSAQLPSRSYVFEILDGDTAIRIVVPNGQITAQSDVSFTDGAAVAYGVTLSCFPDDAGNKAYLYTTQFAS
jgi:hypothetical protein